MWRGLNSKGLIYGGNLRYKIDWVSFNGLKTSKKIMNFSLSFQKIMNFFLSNKNCVAVPFLLCFIFYLRAISKYKPQTAYIRKGRCNGGLFALRV